MLFDDSHRAPIVEKFRAEGVDGIIAATPTLVPSTSAPALPASSVCPCRCQAPRDRRLRPDGTRLCDSQCGLFATGKVPCRFQVPFTT